MKFPSRERPKVQIIHLSDMDVVLSRENAESVEVKTILDILEKPQRGYEDKVENISYARTSEHKRAFFVKRKQVESQYMVDVILGRESRDPIAEHLRYDFNNKARYALAGVLNEVILSKKIKKLVASESFQKIAHKYGFTALAFQDPIVAIVKKHSKFLVYNFTEEQKYKKDTALNHNLGGNIVEDLRVLFVENGIVSHDLRETQFMVDENNRLILIDTEAYTEEKPPK